LSGYGDSGSGEASGDDASGSGEMLAPAYVNDLWQFASNTTHSPLTVPRSGVAKQGNHLFTVFVDIACLIIIPMCGTMSYC